MFNIITRKTLLIYCLLYPKASNALREWYVELVKSDFQNFNELKEVYGIIVLDNNTSANSYTNIPSTSTSTNSSFAASHTGQQ